MITQEQVQGLAGTTAYDRSNDKIGKVGNVYADDQTGEPSWVTVNTGLFGMRESFVPVQGADLDGDRLVLAYEKQQVKDAPHIEEDGHLSPEEEQSLFRHYGLDYATGNGDRTGDGYDARGSETGEGLATTATADRGGYDADEARSTTGTTVGGDRGGYDADESSRSGRHEAGETAAVDPARTNRDDATGTVGHDTSGPTTDDAMTVSEERLRVGTERVEAGRARLRKYVVTENVTQTVPVSHEEVRVEREPITDANRGAAYDGPAISEEEHEVVLHAERPVVDKDVEAVERVRLNTETVTGEQQVSDEVRKERVDTDGVETATGERTGNRAGEDDRR